MKMRLDLGSYLARHGLTAYRLAQESRGKLAPNTVYAMAKKPAQRIDLDTVAVILQTLERVQRRPVFLADLLLITEEPTLHGDPDRPAFDAGHLKTFRRTKRQGLPKVTRPSEDILAEMRGQR